MSAIMPASPRIDPAQHRLMLHGLVDKPLIFTMDDIRRFPSQSQIYFLECSGNPGYKKPYGKTASDLVGLVGCAEWTGVSLKLVLQEAGLQARREMGGRRRRRRGSIDAAAFRSKNALMMRCWCTARTASAAPAARLPAAALAAWIRRQHEREVAAPPARRRRAHLFARGDIEIQRLMPDGSAREFTFYMEAKSIITRPSAASG